MESSWKERHTVVALCCLMGMLNFSMRFNLSMGIVAMVRESKARNEAYSTKNSSSTPSAYHPTEMCPSLGSQVLTLATNQSSIESLAGDVRKSLRSSHQEHGNDSSSWTLFDWNEKDQGLILGSFFWGYVISQFPSGLLAQKYGGKWIIALGMLSTGILSIVLPHAAMLGGRDFVIGVRVLQGFSEGFIIPAMVNLKAKWFPPEERARLSSICFAGFPFGTAVTLLASGQIIPKLGWPAVFYIPGVLTVFFFFLWIWKIHSSPQCHPSISAEELKYITTSINGPSSSKSDTEANSANNEESSVNRPVGLWEVPWKEIACSAPVWAVFISQFCNSWGHNILKSVGPKYLHSALHFDIHQNSYVAASPHLFQMIFAMLFARLSDHLLERKVISMLTARKLCNSIGQWGIALAFAGIIVSGCERLPAVIFYVMYGVVGGAILSGTYCNVMDISPKYAGVIGGSINTVSNFAGFGAPYLAGLILHNEPSILGWRYVFMIPVAANLIGNLAFLILAKAKRQPWNDNDTKAGTAKTEVNVELS